MGKYIMAESKEKVQVIVKYNVIQNYCRSKRLYSVMKLNCFGAALAEFEVKNTLSVTYHKHK